MPASAGNGLTERHGLAARRRDMTAHWGDLSSYTRPVGGGSSCGQNHLFGAQIFTLTPNQYCNFGTLMESLQNAKYGMGPDETHQSEAKIRTGPHHKGQKAAPILTAKPEIRTKFVVSNHHPQNFVCKASSANICQQNFIPISLSTNLRPPNFIQKLTYTELRLQNFANFRT